MRETKKEGLWFVGCERGSAFLPLPPPRRPPLVNGGACGRVFAFYPAQSAQPLARVACHECEDLCSTMYFSAQSCWAALYSDPFKVHFACNYGAELLKQKCGEREERSFSAIIAKWSPSSFCSTFRPQLTRPAGKKESDK